MVPGQPISNIVPTQINLSAAAAQGENIDTMLILGSSPVIDVVSRMRTYSSLAAVAADFGTTAPEYLAATPWFAQSPQPLSLNIGRWAQTATPAQLVGATLPAASQLISAWTGLTSAAFEIVIDGVARSIVGMNFSAATNLNGVATIIQAALITAGAPAGTTVLWEANLQQFWLTDGSTGASSTLSLANLPAATGQLTFAGQPTASDTITLGGTAVTFVSALTTGNQILIGSSLAVTLQNALTFLSASVDTNISKCTYYATGTILSLAYKTAGTSGNSFTLAKSSTNITLSGATLTGGAGTDISVLAGWNASVSGSYAAQGLAAESALTAVTLFDNLFSNQWYGVFGCGFADSDVIAVAGYVEASTVKHWQGATSAEAAILNAPGVDTSSLAYQLSILKYNKTSVQYSSSNPYAIVSYMARILTTNWSGNLTAITLMFKQEPGVAGENLSTTQLNNLLAKNCNVFINYNNNTTIIQPGVQCSGQFTDTIVGADWFAIELQTNVYNLLYTSTTKVPQTDAGMHQIATVIESTCAEAVNNGLAAPGTWTATGFGNIGPGSYLPKGYYVYQPLVASQTQAQRQQRISVPFQIALKLAGAVHEANLSITLNQ